MNPRLLLLVAGAVTAGAGAWWRFQQDLGSARQRLAPGRRVDTRAGVVEYAERGTGEPILVVHGAGGGWDQGLAIGGALVNAGYRVVAPSRFGYLGTPLPEDASVAAQAKAHLALLDTLGIGRGAVIGVSAGAPSALELAIRHPERVSALALLVPAGWHPTEPGPSKAAAFPAYFFRIIESDFATWAMLRFGRSRLLELLGSPREVLERADPVERERLAALTRTLLPVSARRAGMRNDSTVVSSLPRPEIESLEMPLLTVSAPDDRLETAPAARWLAEHAPDGRYVELPGGGHLMVGQWDAVRETVAGFLGAHARQVPTGASRTRDEG